MSRQNPAQFAMPGARPWLSRGGGHPLGGGAQPLYGPMAGSQPSALPDASSQRPTSLPLPRFGFIQPLQPQFSLPRQHAVQSQVVQAVPHMASQLPASSQLQTTTLGAASMRGMRFTQPMPSSQPPVAFASWSQRSQVELMDEQHTVADNIAFEVADGSAPQQLQAADNYGPSQDMSLPPVSQTAAKLLGEITRKGLGLEDSNANANTSQQLTAISNKLEAVMDILKADLAAHGQQLADLTKTCTDLQQAMQSLTGSTGSDGEQVQALLAKPKLVTGDMGVQTSPMVLPAPAPQPAPAAAPDPVALPVPAPAPAPAALPAPPAAPAPAPRLAPAAAPVSAAQTTSAAAPPARVSGSILQTFNQQRRPSSADNQPAQDPGSPRAAPWAPSTKPTVPTKPTARRGLAAAPAAAPAAVPAACPAPLPTTKPTKPTTHAHPAAQPQPQPPHYTRRTATASATQQENQQASGGATQLAAAAGSGHSSGKQKPAAAVPGSVSRPHRAAKPTAKAAAAEAATKPSSRSKRRLEGEPSSQAGSGGTQGQQQPAAKRRQLEQPAKQRQPTLQPQAAKQPQPAKQRQASTQPQTSKQSLSARRAPAVSRAESMFDSFFCNIGSDGEEPSQHASPAGRKAAAAPWAATQPAARSAAPKAASGGGAGGGSSSDLAAAVQQRMQRHRAKLAARRRGGLSTQLDALDG